MNKLSETLDADIDFFATIKKISNSRISPNY